MKLCMALFEAYVCQRLVMKEANLREVQKAMGHKTIQMTCRYAHLAPDHELAVVERLCENETTQREATDTRTSTDVSESSSLAPLVVQ
jgi:Phage integrase family